LKAKHSGTWDEWETLLKDKVGIGKSRASELMAIADGRKTVEGVRAADAAKRKRLRNERRSPGRPGEKAEAANESDENEVPKRNNRSGDGRHQEGLKLQDNSDDGDEQVASPEVIERNLRDSISRHYAGAEAARKVIKASRLGNEARREI